VPGWSPRHASCTRMAWSIAARGRSSIIFVPQQSPILTIRGKHIWAKVRILEIINNMVEPTIMRFFERVISISRCEKCPDEIARSSWGESKSTKLVAAPYCRDTRFNYGNCEKTQMNIFQGST
jgi:hypothetical protein